ncbi:hypothetical protein VTI28DRAFT_7471 [Corynascus sepedonium]
MSTDYLRNTGSPISTSRCKLTMRGKGFISFRDCPFAMDIVPLLPRIDFVHTAHTAQYSSDRAETRKPLVGPKYKTDVALIGPFVSCADII